MEQELYYLIAKFLAAGPCNNAARALENELNQNRQLLPHTITYDGKQVPMTMDRLSKEYPNISNNYLLELLGRFLSHFKETGDPTILRVSALRHGDKSLLTMLSAFVPHQEVERCNYLTMTPSQLDKLSIHRMLIAREMGARVLKKNEMPTSLSTFYRERVTISGHRNPVYSVVFDKTNRRLFTGSDDFLVKVWCVRTGYLIHTIRGHQNVITDIAINQENTLIATASTDGCVRVWTMDEYKPIMCLRPNSTAIKPFTTVKFSPSPRAETRYLMATNEDGFVRLWRWDRDTLQFFDVDSPITFSCRFRAKDRLRCSSFDYTGTKFTVAGDDGFVYVFSTVQVQTTHEGVTSHSSGGGGAGHADMSSQDRPGGRGRRKVANALFPDKNSHLQPQPVVSIGTLEGHMGSVTDLAYSHDGQRILSGCQDGTARIWTFNKEYKQWSSITLSLKEPVRADADTVKLSTPASTVMSRSTSINHQDTLNDMASSSTAPSTEEFGTLMPSLDDGFMQSTTTTTTDMDLDESEHPPAAFLDPPKVSMIAWSADDRWCFVASNYGDIRVYYASSGDIACVLKGHEGEIYALDNHPLDSSTILSAGYDGNVILWDVQKKKVINCTQHRGRTFTDCKFSKDGMKYAITDEEGHCTLFGIGGLDKDYEQVRSWERGQYFMSDYQALRHFADGSFVDEPTQQPPYAMPSSPIIDLQGVAYPNQKKLGYGRNIPTTPETFELEDMRRSACYDQEEEEIRALKCITLPALDRATVAKRRREFVRFEDDEEGDLATAGNIQFQFPPPVLPALLPDDSADEDYHDDEAGNAGYASSANSSDDERGSDEFVTRDNEVVFNSDDENDEEGPVTRSRAGQTPIRTPRTTAPNSNNTLRHATTARRRGRGRGAGVGRGRGRGGRGGSRATRKRNRDASDEEEDQPVRARTRRRVTERPSYAESDFESEEDEFVNVDNDPSDAQDSDHSEAGPSNRAAHYTIDTGDLASSSAAFTTTTEPAEPQDRKGKRKLRSAAAATTTTTTTAHASDDEFTESPYQLRQYQHYMQHQASTSSSSGGGVTMPSTSTSTGRATRSRAHLPDIPVVPAPSHSHKPPATAAASSTTATTTAAAKASNNKRSAKHRDGPRELTEDEIKEHEPIPWITNTERSLAKYLPQVGDMVAILTEGHKQYLKKSQMRHLFDEKHGVIDKHEPVLFARVNSISWLVGPPAYCKLKLHMLELHNLPQVIQGQEEPLWSSLQQDHIIEYTDEDDSPEFIVLWERFLASMNVFLTLDVGQKVDAIYDEGQYTGTVSSVNNHGQIWKQANLPSPWAFYHVIWDDASSNAEDLSPWELVPTGEDFRTRYDVGSTLTPAQIKRAKDTIAWLESVDDFYLYVHQVNYYDYPPYLSVIAYPICLDTVKERLGNGYYRTVDGLLDDVELIKKNAMKYNAESSPAHKNAIRLAHFFKTRIQKPSMPLAFSRGGGKKKVVVEESDDEYDNDVEEQKYESEEEPRISRKERHYSDEEDDFVDEDDDEDDYYG